MITTEILERLEPKSAAKNFKDIEGRAFGRLTVIGYVGRLKNHSTWLCGCSCGEVLSVAYINLTSGHTKSCGCLNLERVGRLNRTHGKRGTRTYRIWAGMKDRCRNSRNPAFQDYGARGITTCDRWNTFENFFADMGECPAGLTIERIDNNSGYSPDNCKWASMGEQSNNRRNNVLITYKGKTQNLKQWCSELGVRYRLAHTRLRKSGWTDPARIFETPSRRTKPLVGGPVQ